MHDETSPNPTAPPGPIAKLAIHLEIEGAELDAYHVVDDLLDAGFLQDAIDHHDADAGALHVRSAVVRHHCEGV